MAAFRRVFVFCIAGYNISSLVYQLTQFILSLGFVFGFYLIPITQANGSYTFSVDLALSFHVVLIYLRTKAILQTMKKSTVPLNLLMPIHVGLFVLDMVEVTFLLQLFIPIIDIY
jgi:hypothetical protein